MHRSFDAWKKELDEERFQFDTPDQLELELKTLEADIPLTLKEAEQLQASATAKKFPKTTNTQPFQAGPYHSAALAQTKKPLTPRQEKMAQFTETLAQEVIEKLERLEQLEKRDYEREQTMAQYRPKMERVDELMRDNRTLAQQVKQLLEERTRMLDALSYYEREYPRFQKMAGNMYIKR